MSRKSQKIDVRSQNRAAHWFGLLTLLVSGFAALAAALPAICSDREAIERVYYSHRVGEKPPFEQTLPPAALENLVCQDLRKETVLRRAYGVELTHAMLDAEVRRIHTTTRAPEMLAEIKAALRNDPERFANVFAKPILVERLLREKFENDDRLHAPQRCQADQTRAKLLAAKTNGASCEELLALLKHSHSNAVAETTWQLTARPAETNASAVDDFEIKKRFGPNAQVLSSPGAARKDRKSYFEELPEELQKVLCAQLRQAGDLSAVIETPRGFLLYIAKQKTDTVLTVATLSLPKRNYEQWLAEQTTQSP
jgi:hypothetical protein